MKHIFLALAVLTLGLSSCKKDDAPAQALPEITVGERNEAEIVLDKGNTIDKMLSGGNGKFSVSVQDSKIITAKIEGSYLKITGLNYGKTTISLRSHDKQKTLTVRVERPAINLSDKEVRLYPGEVRKNITVRGGGDDAVIEILNPEEAIDARWDAKTGALEIAAKYEGEATIVFKTKDEKPDTELKVIVKAETNVSDQVGFYATKSQTLRPYFPVVLHAYRPGKMLWISNSSDVVGRDKTRLWFAPVKSPEKGAKVVVNLSFLNMEGYTAGEQTLIVEEVVPDRGLVTLRGKGFKIVAPYDK